VYGLSSSQDICAHFRDIHNPAGHLISLLNLSVSVHETTQDCWTDIPEMLYLRTFCNKNEYQNMFNAERDMRMQLFKIMPDFKALVSIKEFYPSY
jgi:hypothetical protein